MTVYTLSIFTNGWHTPHDSSFYYTPRPRACVGLSAYFEAATMRTIEENKVKMPVTIRSELNRLQRELNMLESCIGGASNPENSLLIRQAIDKIKEDYPEVTNVKEETFSVFESTQRQIAFKIDEDTAADIIGHAQKGRIVEITHTENGEIDNITVREPRFFNRAKPSKAAATLK